MSTVVGILVKAESEDQAVAAATKALPHHGCLLGSFQPIKSLMLRNKKETFPWAQGALSFVRILRNAIKMRCLIKSPSRYL